MNRKLSSGTRSVDTVISFNILFGSYIYTQMMKNGENRFGTYILYLTPSSIYRTFLFILKYFRDIDRILKSIDS